MKIYVLVALEITALLWRSLNISNENESMPVIRDTPIGFLLRQFSSAWLLFPEERGEYPLQYDDPNVGQEKDQRLVDNQHRPGSICDGYNALTRIPSIAARAEENRARQADSASGISVADVEAAEPTVS
jgi:hypothetical protein